MAWFVSTGKMPPRTNQAGVKVEASIDGDPFYEIADLRRRDPLREYRHQDTHLARVPRAGV